MIQVPFSGLLIASAVAGALSASVLIATVLEHEAMMTIEPATGVHRVDDSFTVSLEVHADVPVNVFKGILDFDHTHLQVVRIDYNTSIADLWAEEPWYENGNGTLSFIGGTTRPGGFTGTESLITVTFTTITPGDARLALRDVRILRHDGLGTEAAVPTPIDALFTIATSTDTTSPRTTIATAAVTILANNISTDLNGDGIQSLADISIFMRDLGTQNKRSDFNQDGLVSTKDLSIILNQ